MRKTRKEGEEEGREYEMEKWKRGGREGTKGKDGVNYFAVLRPFVQLTIQVLSSCFKLITLTKTLYQRQTLCLLIKCFG